MFISCSFNLSLSSHGASSFHPALKKENASCQGRNSSFCCWVNVMSFIRNFKGWL